MPKGKGRKTGVGQTNSPRRTSASSSQQKRAITTSIECQLNSTRIADADSYRTTSSPVFSMADVARRQHLSPTGSKCLEAEMERQISRRRTRARGDIEHPKRRVASHQRRTPTRRVADVEPGQTGYVLDFVVGPPSQIATGTPMSPAVTLQVRRVPHESSSIPPEQNLHQYIAVATLVTADRSGTLSAVAPGILGGPQMADSVHAPEIATNPDILGYISFPDLDVRFVGDYRIRVSLMRLDSVYGSRHGGTTLQTADSGFINVSNA